MLYEPGPLALFTDAEIPRSSARPAFEGLAAREAGELLTAAANLTAPYGVLVGAPGTVGELRAGADLLAAVDEHDRQSREFDLGIGAVSGDAGTLEQTLAGLTSELARDLEGAAVPPTPDGPRGPNPDEAPIGSAEWNAIVRDWYQRLLGRDAEDWELVAHYGNPGGLPGILAVIMSSEEYLARQRANVAGVPPPPAPAPSPSPAPAPTPSGGGNVNVTATRELIDLYVSRHPDQRDRVNAFAAQNNGDWHRMPHALELPGWIDFLRSL